MRYITCIVLLVVIGCASKARPSSSNVDQAQARQILKAQADELGQAALHLDHEKMADFTHPVLIKNMGGRPAFVKALDRFALEIKGQGFQFTSYTVKEPSELVESGGEVFGIVPTEVNLSGPNGAKGRQPSFLVAVSEDRGAHWTFLDGEGIRGDRSKLKALLPNFPDKLELPGPQSAIWQK
jgi:hypothetical protein